MEEIKSTIDANITPNGEQGITGSVLNRVLNDMVDATEGKLAQLDQEWQGLQEQIQDAVIKVEVLPHIEKVVVEGGAAILQPDKFYMFGEVAQIALDFAPVADAKNTAVYAFQFTSPANAATTITMPDNAKFPNDKFVIEPGKTYQVNVVEGLALATSWEG